MNAARRISDLAREVEVPISTLRYYERVGLLTPDGRTEGNYRLYEDGAVGRLRFIRAAQAAGFTLDDIRMLLELREGNTARCKEVRPLVEKRLADVDLRLQDLKDVRIALNSFLDTCRRSDEDDSCGVMDELA